jgi:uncharacterized protein
MISTLGEKTDRLRAILTEAGSAAIALSGGTDSSFLVHFASGISTLDLLAVTVSTPYMFESEVREAAVFCRKNGVKHVVKNMEFPGSVKGNPPDRCYLCKKEVMKAVRQEADKAGMKFIFDGTNTDDVSDYRPGMKALKESGVRSPLLEAGLTKEEIRLLASKEGLEAAGKPSNTCLLTRFPHDTLITPEALRRAEKAETFLKAAGFEGSRVRVHGDMVRIECRKEQLPDIISEATREKIIAALKELGYRYITVDLEGYRSGSMNKTAEK